MSCLPHTLAGNRMAEGAKRIPAKRKILSVAIGEKSGLSQLNGAVFVNQGFFNLISNNFCKKEIMGSKLCDGPDFALKGHRTFFERGDCHICSRLQVQTEMFDFINLSPGTAAAEVCHFQHGPGGEVDDEFPTCKNILVRQALLAHRYGYHRRAGTGHSGPANSKDIGIALLVYRRYQHRRHRPKQDGTFKEFLGHSRLRPV